jgi:signal transduction histidine kinase
VFVLSTATAHRLFGPCSRSGAFLDVAIAIVALAGSLALISHGGIPGSVAHGGDLDALGILLAACSTLPVILWRRSPMGVFVVTAVASVLLAGFGYRVGVPLGPTAALYLLAASRDDENPWTRRITCAVVALFVAYLGAAALGDGGFPGTELLHAGLAWAVAWFAGERTRLRHEHIAELRERAVRAERDAAREGLLAVAEERARIARDLHDSAGHAINVIAIRAGAARLRHEQEPDRSILALEAIEDLARQTAGEIDQIVGALRDRSCESREMPAPAGLASLQTLVGHHAGGGLDVTVTTAGSPRQLGVAVDLAAYRILQEGLTNAARHGKGAARVELTFGDAALALTITNPVPDGALVSTSGGHGVIGMCERATLLGGSLDADRVNGAFRVRATLPYAEDLS